jgi:lipopolysaccharide biosynthesis regulator YciM
MMENELRVRDMYKCQFCEHEAPREYWQDGSICPNCGQAYDAILAQDGDDE